MDYCFESLEFSILSLLWRHRIILIDASPRTGTHEMSRNKLAGTNPWRHMVNDFNSINSYIAYCLSCDGVVSILKKIFALSCPFVSFNPTNQQKFRTLQFLHALSWNHKNKTMRRPDHQTVIIPSWYLTYFPIPSCHWSAFASLETELYED